MKYPIFCEFPQCTNGNTDIKAYWECNKCKLNFDEMTPSRYKIQYGDDARFAEWSDWINTDTPLPTSNILSIITEKTMTWDEWNDYARKFLNN